MLPPLRPASPQAPMRLDRSAHHAPMPLQRSTSVAPRPIDSPDATTNEQSARETAQKFEAIFLRMMIRDMRSNASSGGDGIFGNAAGSQIKEGWFDTMLAERMASSGQVGLSDALVADWKRAGRLHGDQS